MNIERINVSGITDTQTREVIDQIVECIFEMNREYQRKLCSLTSQNVKDLDFNVTNVRNIETALRGYATKEYVAQNYQPVTTE